MIKKLLLFILFSEISLLLPAQTAAYSNDFLNIGVGASSSALGQAVIAQNRKAESVYWNAASLLCDSNFIQFFVSHRNLYAGLAKQDFFASSYRNNRAVLSVGLLRVAVDDIQNTLNLKDSTGKIDYNRITYFSTADYALFMAYSGILQFKRTVYYSISPKLIYRHVGSFASAYGLGIDLGMFMPLKKWNLALLLKNVSGSYTFWSLNKDAFIDSILPADFRSIEIGLQELVLGINRQFRLNDFFNLNTEIDMKIPLGFQENALYSNSFMAFYPLVGAEISYKKTAFLRMGINRFQRFEIFDGKPVVEFRLSVGAGVQIRKLILDYTYEGFVQNNQLPSSHIVSLGYLWNR